jgi:muconolactone delta-isomerase
MEVIAILRVKPDTTEEQQEGQRKGEAQTVWRLIAGGQLRSIHFHDGPGALLHFEVETKQEAEKLVSELPMVKANLVSSEFLTLKPFTGLQDLFGDRRES